MVKRSLQYVAGDTEGFSLESRIFHTFSAIGIASIFAETIFYLFKGMQEAVVITAILGLILSGFYYLSRFLNKLYLAVSLSIVSLSAIHLFGYAYNGGIAGNAMLLSLHSLFFVLLIVPRKQRLWWFMLTMAILLVMVLWEYLDPAIVKKQYSSKNELYSDLVVTYLIAALMIYIGTVMLRNNYDKQKDAAEHKALSLAQSNQEKDKLFSIISHDLSAPLASVRQYLDLLQAAEVCPEEREIIEQRLRHSLNDANSLLDNLLLWAKNQMQLNYVQIASIPIKTLLEETISLFQTQAQQKQIHISLCAAADLHVRGDQNMLKVVLRNLLQDAIKFSHLGGAIEFRAINKNQQCIISLRDKGIGIMEEKQSKIFTLNITSSYGTANEKGSGLGLILSKDLMTQLGGAIWFDSTPWEGTTFYVSLPNA